LAILTLRKNVRRKPERHENIFIELSCPQGWNGISRNTVKGIHSEEFRMTSLDPEMA